MSAISEILAAYDVLDEGRRQQLVEYAQQLLAEQRAENAAKV